MSVKYKHTLYTNWLGNTFPASFHYFNSLENPDPEIGGVLGCTAYGITSFNFNCGNHVTGHSKSIHVV